MNKNINSKVIHLKKNFLYKLEQSLSKRITLFNNRHSGWDGKKMKISKKFRPKKDWYENKIFNSHNLNFDKTRDFIVIPEIWAHFAIDLGLAENKINYAIFVF